jgi:L-alanine-DL-glutamate epimerase-like enolase superfamily enzyme
MASNRQLFAEHQSWPIAGDFKISRGTKSAAHVVYVEIEQSGKIGRGECLPYAHYGETPDSVIEQIKSVENKVNADMSRTELLSALEPGAARNALDCALWDLEAKQAGTPVWQLAHLAPPQPVTTAYSLSLGSPDEMRAAAAREAHRPLLKAKMGQGDTLLELDRMSAIREGAPTSEIILDANEGWAEDQLGDIVSHAEKLKVTMIEQPLPAAEDSILEGFDCSVLLGADESFHAGESLGENLGEISTKYDVVNIKLDKTGGLTQAMQTLAQARQVGLEIMIGCMVSTSMSMAPALLLAPSARFIDLDGALLLAKDRDPGLAYDGSTILPSPTELWGYP